MKTFLPMSFVRLAEVKVGNLVAVSQRQNGLSFAIKLESPEGFPSDQALMAFIRPMGVDRETSVPRGPHHATRSQDDKCFDFGDRAVIEPVFDADGRRYAEYEDRGGVIAVAGDRKLIRLERDPSNIHSNPIWLDLESLEFSSLRTDAAYFTEWRMWRDEESRSAADGKPLFTFSLPKMKP